MKDQRKYSGTASKSFWKRIEKLRLTDGSGGYIYQDLYRLGVLLQNLEGYVLEKLEKSECVR